MAPSIKRPIALRILDHLEESLIAVLMAAGTLVVFAAVIHRYSLSGLASLIRWARSAEMDWLFGVARDVYLAGASIDMIWAQELCIFLIIWMAKVGAAYGVRTGIHVGVDIVLNAVSPHKHRMLLYLGLAAGALFTFLVGTLGLHFVLEVFKTGQSSADLEIPMWLVYAAVPVGSYLMCFRFLEVAWRFARDGELPHQDHAHVEGVEVPDTDAPDQEVRP